MRPRLLGACIILLAGSGLWACRKAKPLSNPLKNSVQAVASRAPCDSIIPMEWAHSFPVPTGRAQGREFRVFFYPLGQPGTPGFVKSPMGEATLIMDGAISSCSRFPGEPKGLAAQRWPAALSKIGMGEFSRKLDGFYGAAEKAAALYAAKPPASDETRKIIQEYRRWFNELAEPALLPYYYQLNPDFWEWLDASAAPTAAKPR